MTNSRQAVLAALLKAKKGGEAAVSAETGDGALAERMESSAARFAEATDRGLSLPFFALFDVVPGAVVQLGGRRVINFSSYNYLGLTGDPRINEAAKDAIDTFGTTVGASRIASGERSLHQQLEKDLSEFLGVESALVMISGFGANESVIGHLLSGSSDLILHDSLIHRSALEGARLSGARRLAFRHNDLDHLEALLTAERGRHRDCLITVEGLYSMDGDVVDLARLAEIKRRHRCLLMVDEAHSIGVLGETGRGIGEECGVDRAAVDIWMGTLSKSFAASGGYLAGSRTLIDYLRYTVPGFVFSVGIAPPLAAASLRALDILKREPWRVGALRRNAERFLDLARRAGLDTSTSQGRAVVPIMVGDAAKTLYAAGRVFEEGISAQPVIYPAVSPNEGRLRLFLTAAHDMADVERSVNVIRTVLNRL